MFKATWLKGRECVYLMRMSMYRPIHEFTPYNRKGSLSVYRKGRTHRDLNPIKYQWAVIERPPKRRGIW